MKTNQDYLTEARAYMAYLNSHADSTKAQKAQAIELIILCQRAVKEEGR